MSDSELHEKRDRALMTGDKETVRKIDQHWAKKAVKHE